MSVSIEPAADCEATARFAAEVMNALPMWFGRPDSNAAYARGMASRDCFLASVEKRGVGLMALEYQFGATCNVWWLAVLPGMHRRGVGKALLATAEQEAHKRNMRMMAVLTMGPSAESPEYALTRRFYEASGYKPFVEFEPEPGDFMMWMMKPL